MTKRQQNALITKQKLLDTAEDLIKTNGLSSLSVEEITKKADVAKGTFYTYFKHKEDIIAEICRGYFKQIELEITKTKNKNIVEKLTVFFVKFMDVVEIYGINICREWIKSALDPKTALDNNGISKWQYDFNMLENILKTAVKNNELKKNTPIELLVHLIISQLYGMMTVWCMSDSVFEPKNWTKKFCNIQLKALLDNFIEK